METAIKTGKRKFKSNGNFYLFLKDGKYFADGQLTAENRAFAVSQFTNCSEGSRASWSETKMPNFCKSKHRSKLRKRNMAIAHMAAV